MISLQIINLLPKQQHPHILAQELDDIERVGEAWSVAGESRIPNTISRYLHVGSFISPPLLLLYFARSYTHA